MNKIGDYICLCTDLIDGPKCRNKVLVLSGQTVSKGEVKQPSHALLTLHGLLLEGEPKQLDCFQAEANFNIKGSCPITWKNKIHIYGGLSDEIHTKQILRLDGHVLKRIGTLNFDQFGGAGTAIQNRMIILCFSFLDRIDKICRKATGPLEKFTDLAETNFRHTAAPISASQS